jgi:oxygen-independent coproporphyrinogen III oxidase
MKIREDLAQRYNYPVPRYTSYPPANRFTHKISESDYLSIVADSNGWAPSNLSFYIHIPFCDKLCFYCGCNSFRTRHSESVARYFEALSREISAVLAKIDGNRKISQIHFGGGTPNSVPVSYLKSVVGLLSSGREFAERAEIAIECHPALLDTAYIDELKSSGFNRFSLGIQDLNSDVLKLVNRDPSVLPVEELINSIRSSSDIAINLDFIYGLPGQTPESFARTIESAAALRPDRLVTFSYAHVPWVNPNQKRLELHGLPDTSQKLRMFEASYRILTGAGYRAVGLDHFVLEGDDLDIASRSGQLHRNFQGYCTLQTTGQVYAFGASGITQLERAYIQNTRNPDEYADKLLAGCLPVATGYMLSESELFVKAAIDTLMCNRTIDFDGYAKGVSERFGFEPDRALLNEFEVGGILTLEGGRLQVTDDGVIFIRNIAAAMDPLFPEYVKSFSKPV